MVGRRDELLATATKVSRRVIEQHEEAVRSVDRHP
jgi:hypothetical protein